jgi:hypothetical protein
MLTNKELIFYYLLQESGGRVKFHDADIPFTMCYSKKGCCSLLFSFNNLLKN